MVFGLREDKGADEGHSEHFAGGDERYAGATGNDRIATGKDEQVITNCGECHAGCDVESIIGVDEVNFSDRTVHPGSSGVSVVC